MAWSVLRNFLCFNCVLQFYKANGIEWPTVTVEYKDVNVSMDVSAAAAINASPVLQQQLACASIAGCHSGCRCV